MWQNLPQKTTMNSKSLGPRRDGTGNLGLCVVATLGIMLTWCSAQPAAAPAATLTAGGGSGSIQAASMRGGGGRRWQQVRQQVRVMSAVSAFTGTREEVFCRTSSWNGS